MSDSEPALSGEVVANPNATYDDPNWGRARKYLEQLGPISPLVFRCVRALRALETSSSGRKASDEFNLKTLYRSPSVRALLYSYASQVHNQELSALPDLNGETLIDLIPISELASLVGTTYLYRRLTKLCKAEVWEKQSNEIRTQIECAIALGKAIPQIGISHALLIGAIRPMAMTLLSDRTGEEFKLYRRHFLKHNLLWDLREEEKLFGCNHLQISSILVQRLGFGASCSLAISSGLDPSISTQAKLEGESMSWQAGGAWIESLLVFEKAPAQYSESSMYALEPAALKALQERIDSIQDSDNSSLWIGKRKEDLAPEISSKIAARGRTNSSSQNSSQNPTNQGEAIAQMPPEAAQEDLFEQK